MTTVRMTYSQAISPLFNNELIIDVALAYRHPNASDGSARPPLAHVERSTQVSDSLSLGGGRHHFFASRLSGA